MYRVAYNLNITLKYKHIIIVIMCMVEFPPLFRIKLIPVSTTVRHLLLHFKIRNITDEITCVVIDYTYQTKWLIKDRIQQFF